MSLIMYFNICNWKTGYRDYICDTERQMKFNKFVLKAKKTKNA